MNASARPSLRARLKQRADTEHEMTLNRVVLVALALVYLAMAGLWGDRDAQDMLSRVLNGVLVYFALTVALFCHLLAYPAVSPARRLLGIVLDFGMMTFCLTIGGAAAAPLYPIYLWVILGYGFRFGNGYLASAALAATASFAVVAATVPFWRANVSLAGGLLVGLVALPAYVSLLIRRLSHATKAAQEADRAKSLFLASVSHELRTPLTAIIGLSDLLRGAPLGHEEAGWVETIGTSGRSLLDLISSILDFSRIDAGRTPVDLATIDLPGVLHDVRNILAVQARSKGIDLCLFVAEDVPLRIATAERALREVLMNLCANAVKFTDVGSVTVAVERHTQSSSLCFSVTDTGIGIAPDAQGRIFESFTQADETIIDRFGGTGLGLAIAKKVVEAQGGAIGVESVPGRGSRFWFDLPFVTAATEDDAPVACQPVLLVSTDYRASLALEPAAAPLRTEVTLEGARQALSAMRAAGAVRPVVVLDEALFGADVEDVAAGLAHHDETVVGAFVLLAGGQAPSRRPPGSPFYTAVSRPFEPASLARALRITAGARRMEVPSIVARDGTRSRRLSVLLAEDNRTNQKVLSKIIERAGHTVTIVEDGEAAVETLLRQRFNIVLMDVNMPVMNGIDAAKMFRFSEPAGWRVPIVALTADATVECRQRCEEAGMQACVTKPIGAARLVELIEGMAQGDAITVPEALPAATATPSGSPTAIIDVETLAELEKLGGKEFVGEVVAQFVGEAAAVLKALSAAVADGDVEGFRDQAHALRSSAANVGARGLFEALLSWRQIAPEELAASGEAHMRVLQLEFARVSEVLASHLDVLCAPEGQGALCPGAVADQIRGRDAAA